MQITQDPEAADFILAHGTEALGAPAGSPPATPPAAAAASTSSAGSAAENGGGGGGGGSSSCGATPCSLEQMQVLLQRCAKRGQRSGRSVPMVVANPDVVTVHGAELRTMPGTLARWYSEMGGEVRPGGERESAVLPGRCPRGGCALWWLPRR